MKLQVTRSHMLAEEMTRLAIARLFKHQIAHPGECRLLEINFKTSLLTKGGVREIETSGYAVVHDKVTQKPIEFWFCGEAKLAQVFVNHRWIPAMIKVRVTKPKADRCFAWLTGPCYDLSESRLIIDEESKQFMYENLLRYVERPSETVWETT